MGRKKGDRKKALGETKVKVNVLPELVKAVEPM